MRDRYSLTFAWLSALACAGTEPIQVEPGADEPTDVIACYCPERAGCGSWQAQTGLCHEYHGHNVFCDAESCDCGCTPEETDKCALLETGPMTGERLKLYYSLKCGQR